jgi:putative transposase
LKEIPKIQHRPAPKPLAHNAKTYDDQQKAMAAAYLSGGYTMKAIADGFGVHYATVSRAVKHYENSQNED